MEEQVVTRQEKQNNNVEKNIVCLIQLVWGSESGLVWWKNTLLLCFFVFVFWLISLKKKMRGRQKFCQTQPTPEKVAMSTLVVD